LFISRVIDDSPADNAGIKSGDIIIRFNEHLIEKSDQLLKLLTESRIGELSIVVLRDNKIKELIITPTEKLSK
jgi:S1-C subfamily serine protease